MFRSPTFKLIALAVLAASALGGAYLGFQSGGGFHDTLPDAKAIEARRKKPDLPVRTALGNDEVTGVSDLVRRLKKFFRDGDDDALAGLLPNGITEIEGSGGKGLNRQVKSHGVWFPVFDLSKGMADGSALTPETVQLASVRLAIASPNPPQGTVGQAYAYRFTAVGGKPPCRWSMQMSEGTESFVLDPASGAFSGLAAEPVTASLNVFVTDAAGATASAAFSLVIAPDHPLVITTASLVDAITGQPYAATLAGEGGVEPYTWTMEAGTSGLSCDPTTGIISGTPTKAEELSLMVRLTDSQRSYVERSFSLKVMSGLDILTESPLPPATPGTSYAVTFEASGGSAPFTWKVVGGTLPQGWRLTPTGELSGYAPEQEGQYHFIIEVTDSSTNTYRKTFELGVLQPLIVVPSRNKAGLVWQPLSIIRSLGSPLQGVSIHRSGVGADVEVYRGTSNNMVDHNLVTGATYDYKLTAHTVDGRTVPFGATRIKVLPMTLQRAVPGVTGDPYADRVVAFNPLAPGGFGAAFVPLNVTGPPDGQSTFAPAQLPSQLASLHARLGAGGSITLEFTDNIIEVGNGPDFTVFENVLFRGGDPNNRFMEPAVVDVALFEGQWFSLPFSVNTPVNGPVDVTRPTYYAQGFAGVNATTGDDPTNPARSGGDSLDANAVTGVGLKWIRFIRIRSTGQRAMRAANGPLVEHTNEPGALTGTGSSGFDLDAVSAVNY